MDQHLAVRAATSEDYSSILELLRSFSLPVAGLRDEDSFVVIRRGEQVIACAAIEQYGKVGLLRSVAVASAEHGRGLGRKLVERLIAGSRTKGLTELVLLTTTASKFFAKLGFETINRAAAPLVVQDSIEFREACPSSATVMHLRL